MKYYYYNDFPLGIATGGKEDQLKFVVKRAKQVFGLAKDLATVNSFEDNSILHCFGDTPHFSAIAKYLTGTGKNFKFIISPNFFRRKALIYKISKISSLLGPNWWSQRHEMYQLASLIIVNSSYEKEYLRKIFGDFILSKTVVIYNTYELVNHKSNPKLKKDFPYLVSIAHINERKNPFNLLKAAERVYKETGITTILIGGLRFSEKNNVKKFLNLIDRSVGVKWEGEQCSATAMQFLSNSLGHILPSFVESPGLSNIQAYLFKKPMVCGDFPIVREYFKHIPIYCGFRSKNIERAMISLIRSSQPKFENKKNIQWSSENVSKQYIKLFENIYETSI